jgi:hypothetical protein
MERADGNLMEIPSRNWLPEPRLNVSIIVLAFPLCPLCLCGELLP